jgi:hypothetical protein
LKGTPASPGGPDDGRAAAGHGVGIALAAVALAFGAACAPVPDPTAPLTILARCAPFPGIEAAAVSESLVHWNDADPADDDACTESYAAVELRDALRRCPGVRERRITLLGGDRLPPAGDVIVLGNPRTTPLVSELLGRALPDESSPDAFRIRSKRTGGRTVWTIAGTGRTGTLYGSEAFLERLGVRFYDPGDSGTVWPSSPVALPARIDVASSPAFKWRGFWAWEPRGDEAFFRWMARRRLNLWTSAEPRVPLLRKLGIRLTGGGHMVQSDYLNPRARDPAGGGTYFETHPEWFGLHGGKRSPDIRGESGDNFCTSNPRAVAELARNLVRSLRGGALVNADLVQVWPLDRGRWCECDACRALGSPSDRAMELLARLAAAVRDARRGGELTRDVTLGGAAYLETLFAPTRTVDVGPDCALMLTFFPYARCYAHTLEDPACAEFNRKDADAWHAWAEAPWRGYQGPLGVCEYWNVSWFKSLPLLFPHVMAADLAAYRSAGAELACYMHVPTAHWGTWRVNHLVMTEAVWSPGLDVDSLLADYATRAYPAAAAPMREFHRALEAATANIMAVEVTIGALGASNPGGRLALVSSPLLPSAHLRWSRAGPGIAPSWAEIGAALRAARTALDRARALARTPAERARLEDDAARFAYGEQTFALWDAVLRLGLAVRGDATVDVRRALANADSAAARLRGIHELVGTAGFHANAIDGLDASHVAPALDYFHHEYDRGRGARGRPAGGGSAQEAPRRSAPSVTAGSR